VALLDRGPIQADVIGMHLKRMIWRRVNEMVRAKPTVAELPTFADLHAAIDAMGAIFKKYAAILTGRIYALEPFIERDWEAIFRVPWLSS